MADFGEGKWAKASKEHRCAGCRSAIPKGENHFHFQGMWEGGWQNWRLHSECYQSWQSDGYGEVSDGYETPERLRQEAKSE